MTVPELRPRSTSELVDATFQLVRPHYVPLLVLSAILVAPSLLVSVLAHEVLVGLSTVGIGTRSPQALGPQLVAGAGLFAAYLWYTVVDGAVVWYAARAYLGEPVEAGVALRRALSRAGALMGTSLLRLLYIMAVVFVPTVLVGVVVGVVAAFAGLGARSSQQGSGTMIALGGLGVLLVLGVIAWALVVFARYVVAPAVVMMEDRGGMAALRRSAELMVGARTRTALLFVLVIAIYVALSLLVTVPLGLFKSTVLSTLAGTLVRAALYPLFAALVTLIYYDRRIRKEALDIELMSGSLGTAHGADAA
jgi:hypothetical protein